MRRLSRRHTFHMSDASGRFQKENWNHETHQMTRKPKKVDRDGLVRDLPNPFRFVLFRVFRGFFFDWEVISANHGGIWRR
jgi:hypothetical protein